MCYFDQNFINHEITSNSLPQLPFTMHKLSQELSKSVQVVNFEPEEFTCKFTPKITITYSSYETADKNSENSLANDDKNMNGTK